MQKFESLREMRLLPGFVEKVRRGQHQFREIVGWYQFRETVPCSIADCGTPHNRGYVVAIQSGRQIGHTNIGHVCGRNEFGQAFEQAHVAAERFLDLQRLRRSIEDTLQELPAVAARARGLLDGPRGATWFRRAIGSLVRVCPSSVYEELVRRAGRGEAVISKSRARTEHDPPAPDGTHRGYVTENVGAIAGLGCLAAPYPLDVLTGHVLKPLGEFSQLSVDDILGHAPTRRWFQEWRKRVGGEFEAVERKLGYAQLFFCDANLRQLSLLANRADDRERLAALHWNDANGVVDGVEVARPVGTAPLAAPAQRRTVNIDKYGLAAAQARLNRSQRRRKGVKRGSKG